MSLSRRNIINIKNLSNRLIYTGRSNLSDFSLQNWSVAEGAIGDVMLLIPGRVAFGSGNSNT